MDNSMRNSILLSELKTKLDQSVKQLLANKEILAWILRYCTKEFRNNSIEEIMALIIDDIAVSSQRVEPGFTNRKISGSNTENIIINEGRVYFDLLFRAQTVIGEGIQVIINLEIQNKYYPGYSLVKRGIFYTARLLSAQADHDFSLSKSEYDKLKKVYSIWICPDVPHHLAHSITTYRIKAENIFGEAEIDDDHDLLETVIVRVGKDDNGNNILTNMLSVLLSDCLEADEKRRILEDRYRIGTFEERRETDGMCDYAQGVEDRNTLRNLLAIMNNLNLTYDEAIEAMEVPEENRDSIRMRYEWKLAEDREKEAASQQ